MSTFGVLQHLARESGSTFAPAVAVDMLSRREHSEAELRRKLSQRGFTTEVIEYALHRVQERDYQSDLRFAQSLVRSRMSGRGVSRAALQAALAGRGVDRELAQRVIDEYQAENSRCFRDALQAALQTMEHQEEPTIIRKLARRGFDVVEIKKFIG